MSADAGADHRAMLALQERADRQDATVAKLQGRLDALALRVAAIEPKPEPVDPSTPSENELKVIKEGLLVRQAEGMQKHRADPGYLV